MTMVNHVIDITKSVSLLISSFILLLVASIRALLTSSRIVFRI